jgi:hypothetical protein
VFVVERRGWFVRYVWRPWRFDVHARAFLGEGRKGAVGGAGFRSPGHGSVRGMGDIKERRQVINRPLKILEIVVKNQDNL